MSRPRPSTAAGSLQIPPRKDFVLLCSPSEIDMVAGEPLPRLTRFAIEPGCMGVPGTKRPDDPIDWRGAVAQECHRYGRVLVDPQHYGLKPRAYGVDVSPLPEEDPADPRTWYVRRYSAHKGPVHVSVWQRPVVIGSQVLWEIDREGEIDFARQVRDRILMGIDPRIAAAVELAARRTADEAEAAARLSPRYRRAAEITRAAVTRPE